MTGKLLLASFAVCTFMSLRVQAFIFVHQKENSEVLMRAKNRIELLAPINFLKAVESSNIKITFASGGIDDVGSSRNNTIRIDPKILNPEYFIKNIEEKTSHLNHEDFIAATIIHELAHTIDHRALGQDDQVFFNNFCIMRSFEDENKNQASKCQLLNNKTGLYSSSNSYISAAGFQMNSKINLINLQKNYSPDVYEFKNLRESFAVNLEYFILDPQYSCRRPAIYHALKGIFGKPTYSISCNDRIGFTFLGIDGKPKFTKISQIQKVSYLFAHKGDQLASKFGHAMLYFTVCPENTNPHSTNCDSNLDQHFVISPAALVFNNSTSAVDGLSGNYDLNYFINPASKVIQTYTDFELRDVELYPLNLNPIEFSKAVSEFAWTRTSSYYFLSNNCSHAVFGMINSYVNLDFIANSGFNPMELRDLLIKKSLINAIPEKTFSSNKYKSKIKQQFITFLELKWSDITTLNAMTLRENIARILEGKKMSLASITQIIYLILNEKKSNLEVQIAAFLKDKEKLSESESKELARNNMILASSVSKKAHYGIPDLSEIQEQISEKLKKSYIRQNQITIDFRKTNGQLIQDFEGIKSLYFEFLEATIQ